MSKYGEKLKDPRWQKKRLEILERDDWKCAFCQEREKTLHVHHLIYETNESPWDSPNETLITLCEPCHQEQKDGMFEAISHLIQVIKLKMGVVEIYDLIDLFQNEIPPVYNRTKSDFSSELISALKRWRGERA